jgi:hypothetical protein
MALLLAAVYVQLLRSRAPQGAEAMEERLHAAGAAGLLQPTRSSAPTGEPSRPGTPSFTGEPSRLGAPAGLPPSAAVSQLEAAPQGASPSGPRTQPSGVFASRCGADAQRGFQEPEPAAYVLALRTNSSEDDLLEDVETVDDLGMRAATRPDGKFLARATLLGIGDAVHRLWRFLGCAARHNLRVVCHPEAFNTALEHHTGYLGFLFGCHSKHLACGLFKSWSDLSFTLSVTQEVPVSQALGMIEAVRAAQDKNEELAAWPPFEAPLGVLNPLPRVWPALPARTDTSFLGGATRTHSLARDGKLVFRAVTCQSKSKRERDELLADGSAFIGYQYVLAYLTEGRSTPLWNRPADRLWRLGVTVRRGDWNRGHVTSACDAIERLYRLSGAVVNAGNSQILVFSETFPEDPEFACLRNMPNARLLLQNKSTSMHNAQARLVRDLDHLASAHFFYGSWGQMTFLIESALDDDATAFWADSEERLKERVESTIKRFPTPFAHADIRFRVFDPRATTASMRYRQGHAINCCSRHRGEP